MKIKKNDNVIVISGKDKGKTGKVSRAFPAVNKVLIEGVNIKKKHQKPTRSGQKGQTVEISTPIDASNVMIVVDSKRSRIGSKMAGDKKVRIAKKTGKQI